MPKAVAEKTLVSTLDLDSGRSWNPSEAEGAATRLVRLLPEQIERPVSPAGAIVGDRAQRTNYWLVWLFFAMAISFFSPHHQTPIAAAKNSTSTFVAKSQSEGHNENIASPAVGDQSRAITK